ncbi:MAG: dTDP-4-dehydrorhamnose reductase [Acutalibacteraceae bacterium]|nr:dTDP-4-dehydrorhamnose reductase [Acutalibacteraceae bacterium]
MKVLVTGFNGQLGYDVIKELDSRAVECKGVDLQDFDITDREQTLSYIKEYKPDVVVHCAAYTAVDKAEDDEENCRKVNVEGSENLALACKELDAKMLYVSTDYVYGGNGDTPFETSDETDPKSVYGRTKLEGENAVRKHLDKYFVVRTSWVFGINGNNFVKTMLRLGAERDELNVVADQIGSPTYTPDLARLICDLIVTEKYGIYHGTNENYCSWAEFAAEIMRLGGRKAIVNPIPSSQYPARAQRPLNSRLSKTCLDEAGIDRLPTWQDALERYIGELNI